MQEKICAIILAAGESKRMGRPKMLLPFRGTTMLEQVILKVRNSAVDDIVVVLGASREKLEELVRNTDTKFCINHNYMEGMLSSVLCGLENTGEFASVLIFPGDQPLIKTETINKLIERTGVDDSGIIVPLCNGKRGHPVLIRSRYRDEIRSLDPDKGLRELMLLHADDLMEVETGDPGILKDFDTYEDYLNGINQIS